MSFVGKEARLILLYLHHQALSYRGFTNIALPHGARISSKLTLLFKQSGDMGKDAEMVSEEETGRRKCDEMLVTDHTHENMKKQYRESQLYQSTRSQ